MKRTNQAAQPSAKEQFKEAIRTLGLWLEQRHVHDRKAPNEAGPTEDAFSNQQGFLAYQYGTTPIVLAAPRSEAQDAELARESFCPEWAPQLVTRGIERHFLINAFLMPPRFEEQGFERLFVTTVQQALTRNDQGAQWVVFHHCPLAVFHMVDTHYNWIRLRAFNQNPPVELPPAVYFPMHLGLSGLSPAQAHENALATDAWVDLAWATPLAWWTVRMRHFFGFSAAHPHIDGMFGVLRRVNQQLGQRVRGFTSKTHFRVRFEKPDDLFRGISSVLFSMPTLVEFVGREKQQAPAGMIAAINYHCRALGNTDAGMPYCIALAFNAIGWGQTITADDILSFSRTFLAYVIEHCRVMCRPLIVESDFITRLLRLAAADDISSQPDARQANDMLPFWEQLGTTYGLRPAPRFLSVVEDNSWWIWVPVERPRTSNAEGATITPPPLSEPVPDFMKPFLM